MPSTLGVGTLFVPARTARAQETTASKLLVFELTESLKFFRSLPPGSPPVQPVNKPDIKIMAATWRKAEAPWGRKKRKDARLNNLAR
jgi:hypothetical protein